MKRLVVVTTMLLLAASIAYSITGVQAVYNPNIPINQGTARSSNPLPDQAKIPLPAGLLVFLGYETDEYVEGCRAWGGGTIPVYVEGQGVWPGGPCCPSNIESPVPDVSYPNQCCNAPDFTEELTPGNHCLCFVLRIAGLTPNPHN